MKNNSDVGWTKFEDSFNVLEYFLFVLKNRSLKKIFSPTNFEERYFYEKLWGNFFMSPSLNVYDDAFEMWCSRGKSSFLVHVSKKIFIRRVEEERFSNKKTEAII